MAPRVLSRALRLQQAKEDSSSDALVTGMLKSALRRFSENSSNYHMEQEDKSKAKGNMAEWNIALGHYPTMPFFFVC